MSRVNQGVPSIEAPMYKDRAHQLDVEEAELARKQDQNNLSRALLSWEVNNSYGRDGIDTLSQVAEVEGNLVEKFLEERDVRSQLLDLPDEEKGTYRTFIVQMLTCNLEILRAKRNDSPEQFNPSMVRFQKAVNWEDENLRETYSEFMASMPRGFLSGFASAFSEEVKRQKAKHHHHVEEKRSIRQRVVQSFRARFKKDQDNAHDGHGHHHHEADLAASMNPFFVDLIERNAGDIKQQQMIIDGLGYDPREEILKEQANKKPPTCGNPNHDHSKDETKVFDRVTIRNGIEFFIGIVITLLTGSSLALAETTHNGSDFGTSGFSSYISRRYPNNPKADAVAGLVGAFGLAGGAVFSLWELWRNGPMTSFTMTQSLLMLGGSAIFLKLNEGNLKDLRGKVKRSLNRLGEEAHAFVDVISSKLGLGVGALMFGASAISSFPIAAATGADILSTFVVTSLSLFAATKLAPPSIAVLGKLKPFSVKKSDYQKLEEEIQSHLKQIGTEVPIDVALEQAGVNTAKVNVLVKESIKDSWAIFGELRNEERKTFVNSLLIALKGRLDKTPEERLEKVPEKLRKMLPEKLLNNIPSKEGMYVTGIEVLSYNDYPDSHDEALKDPSLLNESFVYNAGAPTVTDDLRVSLTDEQVSLKQAIKNHSGGALYSTSLLNESWTPRQQYLIEHSNLHGPSSQIDSDGLVLV